MNAKVTDDFPAFFLAAEQLESRRWPCLVVRAALERRRLETRVTRICHNHHSDTALPILCMCAGKSVSSSYLTEVDFLARVEAAERRDNMSANPAADPAPKYSAMAPTAAASGCSCSGAAAVPASAPAAQKAAAPSAARRPMHQRTSPTREHRVHDETGGAGSRLALAVQGRPPSSQRGQTSGRGGKRGAPDSP